MPISIKKYHTHVNLLSILNNLNNAQYDDEQKHFEMYCTECYAEDDEWRKNLTWEIILDALKKHVFGTCKVVEFLQDTDVLNHDEESFKKWIKPYCEQVMEDIVGAYKQFVSGEEDEE